jgi:hypothetical protein
MCHIPSLRLVWLYFLFYFYFWRKEIQVYYFWMRLIAKDDIPTPPLSWVGYCCTCCYLDGFFLTCYLVVAVGRNGGESSSSWNKKRIRPSAPSWVQLRGAACPRAHPESFGVHFYFYFIFSSIRRNSPCCLSLPSPDWGDIKRANDSADRLPAAGMDGRGTPPFLIVPFVLLQPPPIFCQHKTDNNNI